MFGLLTDFFDNLKDKDAVTHLLYDDMCHLKKHSENPEVAELNEVTEKISKLEKYVDKVSSFLKCVVSIWALPVRARGGAKACQDVLGHFFPTLPGGVRACQDGVGHSRT